MSPLEFRVPAAPVKAQKICRFTWVRRRNLRTGDLEGKAHAQQLPHMRHRTVLCGRRPACTAAVKPVKGETCLVCLAALRADLVWRKDLPW